MNYPEKKEVKFSKTIISLRMEGLVILIERKGGKEFLRFIDLFKKRPEISMKEVHAKIAKSSYYDFILNKIYALNETIKNLDPKLEPFIIPALANTNGKVIQTFKRNRDIEILDDDPNFIYLKVKASQG